MYCSLPTELIKATEINNFKITMHQIILKQCDNVKGDPYGDEPTESDHWPAALQLRSKFQLIA